MRDEYAIDMPLDALVSLVMTANLGIMVEQLSGIDSGHRDLVAWSQEWLDGGR